MTDDELTAEFGRKCPAFGWRGGGHWPAGQFFAPCPDPGSEEPTDVA